MSEENRSADPETPAARPRSGPDGPAKPARARTRPAPRRPRGTKRDAEPTAAGGKVAKSAPAPPLESPPPAPAAGPDAVPAKPRARRGTRGRGKTGTAAPDMPAPVEAMPSEPESLAPTPASEEVGVTGGDAATADMRGKGRSRGRSRSRGGRGRRKPGATRESTATGEVSAAGEPAGPAGVDDQPVGEVMAAGRGPEPGFDERLAALAPPQSPDPQVLELAQFLRAREHEGPDAEAAPTQEWVADLESTPLPDTEPPAPVHFTTEDGLPPLPPPYETGPLTRRRGSRGGRSGRGGRIEGTLRPPRGGPAPEPAETPELAPREPRAPAPRESREAARQTAREAREARAVETKAARERVHKEILVNVDDRETRIAVVEDGRLVELHVEREERVVGSVYKGRVANVLPGMDAAFVDIGLDRNAFLYVGDILFEAGGDGNSHVRKTSREARIKDVAKPGQEILVQVVKGPRGTKGARVSTKMSIPGRFLVLMPDGDPLGVSRKVEEPAERERLRKIAEQLRPSGFGLIVRTEAEEKSEAELRQDLDMLTKLWRQIQEKARRTPGPAIIHQDLSMILKTIRDVFGSDVDKMTLDSETEYQKALDTLDVLSPNLKSRVHLHQEPSPLFSHFNFEEEVVRLLRRKVWLKSGGYLTIDATEALTTIDVNTGKYIGTTSLSDTILKTNLDAVNEIARQLRLRDIGGMIVLDFIDMGPARDRQQVMRALEAAFKKDRTRTKIAHISPLGLVEMTRKRTGEAVTDLMTQACPYCQGRGRVWSAETMAIQIEREIRRRCSDADFDAVLIHANPEVAAWLIGPEGEHVEQLEREMRRPIYVRARHHFHIETYEVLPGDMLEIERQMLPFHGGQVVDCLVGKMELITAPRAAGWVDGYFEDLANGTKFEGQTTRVRLVDVRRSFALAEPVLPAASVDRSEPI